MNTRMHTDTGMIMHGRMNESTHRCLPQGSKVPKDQEKSRPLGVQFRRVVVGMVLEVLVTGTSVG